MARLAIFSRHLTQSTLACVTAMTQGDLSAVTLYHWQVAIQTGLLVGLLAVLFSFTKIKDWQSTRVGITLVALIGTFIADLMVHPTHFGAVWTEALVTGLGAAALALITSYLPLDRLTAKVK